MKLSPIVVAVGIVLLSLNLLQAQEARRTNSRPISKRGSVSSDATERQEQSVVKASSNDSSRRSGSVKPVVAAQEEIDVPRYDLATLREMAIELNPSLHEVSAHIDSLVGKRTQAGLWSNPDVGFSGQQVGSRGLAEQNGVYVGQKIITAQKLKYDQSVISEEIRRAQFWYDGQKLRVETDVALAFYEALAAQKLVDIANELNRIADEGLKTVEALKRGSEASRIDVLQATIEVQQSRIIRNRALKRVEAAWRNLTTVVGQLQLPRQGLAGKLDDAFASYTWDDAWTQLQQRSPELAAAQANAERARWAHQRAMREIYPNINANGLVQKDHAISGWDGAIQVTIPVPILNRNQGAIREALSNVAVAEQAIEKTRLRLENRLAMVFEKYDNAVQQTELYRSDLLPPAREQLELTKSVLEKGEIGYLSLLTAQRSFTQVSIGAIEAQRDLALASTRIDGLLLEGSLEDTIQLP